MNWSFTYIVFYKNNLHLSNSSQKSTNRCFKLAYIRMVKCNKFQYSKVTFYFISSLNSWNIFATQYKCSLQMVEQRQRKGEYKLVLLFLVLVVYFESIQNAYAIWSNDNVQRALLNGNKYVLHCCYINYCNVKFINKKKNIIACIVYKWIKNFI